MDVGNPDENVEDTIGDVAETAGSGATATGRFEEDFTVIRTTSVNWMHETSKYISNWNVTAGTSSAFQAV